MPLLPHNRTALGFLLRHLIAGLTGGLVFGGLILALDISGLRSMLMASQDGLLYTLLLFFGLSVTFGGVAMGVGVMSLGEDKN
ncbi:hypothetical protein [Rhodospirillum rubrum]|uniref:Uncharacterized protein n=1 Tax=Rhodospirillum rubrum (strain ATCC 11170 / ATH 1.1.1 / DSM 467 / LMG 4362 / NCIMB 8255 / S1) TaxID=269796 RepID=Q2RXE9_RHORT|nr:hypothetical protein [Rhodospirillum rubrum]ABC21196.1 hypothetical protein Rru_A0391 [Rhodospirillum rubrum ATCC 11170]AEO46870.1 hypothetical protein F11_02000 [Rhodospirillum rubrum F11]MBK5952744.1 hypothetical protein [Rhodospirillum rubrum]QXG80887.1 hypothetical protein KUL73_02065 [Rhodospirillum rubrum]HAP99985.1 hypothetical protein [Rhodospirillum rubrum]